MEESLNRLVRQTLVQKNGDEYMFLTNEEQDINKAIANEYADPGAIISEISTIIFGDLVRESKYRYSARYNFPYNQMVDDRFYKSNQSADIGVRILTPYTEFDVKPETLRMLSLQENNVIVRLPDDTTFWDETRLMLQISMYITKNRAELANSYKDILIAKQNELSTKKDRIRIYIEDAIKHSEVYVSGDKVSLSAKDPQSKIMEALSKLVATKYSKLVYMETAPTISDIDAIFRRSNQMTLSGTGESTVNRLALKICKGAIAQNTDRRIKTSLKTPQDKFSAAPYGFIDLDVQWLVATLFKQGKIS